MAGRIAQPAYFIVFAIATVILLLTVPLLAILKGYAGLCKTAPPKRNNASCATVKRQLA
jgi:hypothetical protein